MTRKGPVTLIFTNSYDLSVNRIIQRIGSDRVFRFNQDLWNEYAISITAENFRLVSPAGHVADSGNVSKAYWRKPISRFLLGERRPRHSGILDRINRLLRRDAAYPPRMSAEERFMESELSYAIREIKNLLWWNRKLVLVEATAHMRLGKLVQCEIASHFFPVPPYEFCVDPSARRRPERACVVKSLSSERLGANTFLWTTAVREDALDPTAPWYVQELVQASHDVTAVYIRGDCFGFSLAREVFVDRMVDWREAGELTTPLWEVHRLPDDLSARIDRFMNRVGLHYGRLDFLYDGEQYWFLEVNANGEWGWLDPNGGNGVLDRLVEEVHPDTPVHAIPTLPYPVN